MERAEQLPDMLLSHMTRTFFLQDLFSQTDKQ